MQLEEQASCNAEGQPRFNDPEMGKELNAQAAQLARHLQQRNYEWEIETEKLLELEE